MIDYFKVYQSIDDNILKNVVEVIKPNGNWKLICLILLLVFGIFLIWQNMFFLFLLLDCDYKFDKEDYKNMLISFILILILGTLCFLLSNFYFSEENKKQEYLKNIKINNSIKTQKELFKDVMGNEKPKEFLEQGKKLEKFCSFYYSPTDPNFCKDNKINKYTFNLVFSKIYGNVENKTPDLEKALKYIKEEK